MTELTTPKTEITATHIDKKGNLLDQSSEYNKDKGRFEGVFRMLRGKSPEHIFPKLEEIGIIDKQEQLNQKIAEIAQADIVATRKISGRTDIGNDYFSGSYGGEINLAEIAKARTKRGDTPEIGPTSPMVESLLKDISEAAKSTGEYTIHSMRLTEHTLTIKSANGIRIDLQTPSSSSEGRSFVNNKLSLSINAESLGSDLATVQVIRQLDEKYRSLPQLLDLSQDMLGYAEMIAAQLPAELEKRMPERQQQHAAIQAAKAAEAQQATQAHQEELRQAKAREYQPLLLERMRSRPPLSETQQQELAELKVQHPNNPLFKEPWNPEEVAKQGLVEVFHITTRGESLDTIAEQGLKPMPTPERADKVIDDLKKPLERLHKHLVGVNRLSSVFGHPNIDNVDIPRFNRGKGDVTISMLIDPATAVIVDSAKVTEAFVQLQPDSPASSISVWAEDYWRNSITMLDYLKNPASLSRFTAPEILIPSTIPPERMRIDQVYKPQSG